MSDILIILNIFLLEVILSIDNAAVLATMVKRLPEHQQKKALTYGLLGAYVFRGLALLFASLLIKVMWLKVVGGIYLIYLAWKSLYGKSEESTIEAKPISFWGTIVMVEIMDLVFSIDNVFAAVAFTPNIILICFGVFIGILAIRFVAQWFIKLIQTYPFLESIAFIVIAILGTKLTLSLYEHFYPETVISNFLSSHMVDAGISVLTVALFFIPILTSALFNFPKKGIKNLKL